MISTNKSISRGWLHTSLCIKGVVASIVILFALLAMLPAFAEEIPYDILWTRQHGSVGDDIVNGAAVDLLDYIYITGRTNASLDGNIYKGSNDLFLMKFDAAGNRLWTRQLGTSGNEIAYTVAVDRDAVGNAYVVGRTNGALDGTVNAGGIDVFIIKYDVDGNKLWTRQFGSPDNDIAFGVAVDGNGAVYVTGRTNGSLPGCLPSACSWAGQNDIFLAKYDAEGALLWLRQIGTSGNDEAFSLALDKEGVVHIAGYTTGSLHGNSKGGQDLFLMKISPDGDSIWTSQQGTPFDDRAFSVAVDDSGEAYVAGFTAGSLDGEPNGGSDLFIIKFDISGSLLWVKQEQLALDMVDERPCSVAVDYTGAVFVAGSSSVVVDGFITDSNPFLLKYSSGGTLLWSRHVGTPLKDYATAVAVSTAGDVLIAGYTQGDIAGTGAAGGLDIFLMRLGDTAPPTGAVALNGGAAYVHSSPASLSLTCNDSGGLGCAEMRFSNDNVTWSDWETIAPVKTWPLSGNEGTQTVYVQFRDGATNSSDVYSDSIFYDATPPTGSMMVNGGAAYAKSPDVLLALTCSDGAGSGCADMRFSNDNVTWSDWESYAAVKSWTIASGDGRKTVYSQFRDGAGHLSPVYSVSLVLDTAPPSGSIEIKSSTIYPDITNLSSTVIVFSCSDNTSCSEMWVYNREGTHAEIPDFEPYVSLRQWTLSAGDGLKTVQVVFRDAAGNTALYTDTITVDSTITADLFASTLSVPAQAGAGKSISVSDTAGNKGPGAAAPSLTHLYLSKDTVIDGADILLGSRTVPLIAAGMSDTGTTTVTIPADTATGTYFVIAKEDGPNAIRETYENNNTRYGVVKVGPDLSIALVTGPGAAGAGKSITISDTTMSNGPGDAGASVTSYYFSSNSVLDSADVLLGSRAVPALAAGQSDAGSIEVTIPAGTTTGTYYIIAKADDRSEVNEINEYNNTRYAIIKVGPDLSVSSMTVPVSARAGGSITVLDTTMSNGPGDAGASVTSYYFSSNSVLDSADVLLGSRAVPALAAGQSDAGSMVVTIPEGTPTGTYYILAKTDAGNQVSELNENNNSNYRIVTIEP
ncbi:MAG: CARDB domain-containing protein [Nitrospirota bacterium]